MTPLNRLLVVLPNWYGETLFATPFLRALRRQRPGARIIALGVARCREILAQNPDVDDFIELMERRGLAALLGRRPLNARLRAERLDAAWLLRPSFSRALVLAAARIPVRIGFEQAKSDWLLTHRVPRPPRLRQKALEYLPLLAAAGLREEEGPCRYVVSEAERQAGRRLLAGLGVADRPFAVLHPGANWAHKRWPADRFAALGDRLVEAGTPVLITGGPEDAPLRESVRRAMRRPGALLPPASLRETAACLEQAALVVTNDTGIAHITAALGRPLLALFGPTSPQYTGPLGDPARVRVVHHPACCPVIPCNNPEAPPHPGMAAISVEEAVAAARALTASATEAAR